MVAWDSGEACCHLVARSLLQPDRVARFAWADVRSSGSSGKAWSCFRVAMARIGPCSPTLNRCGLSLRRLVACSTEFMQVPNPSSDLVHRTDGDNGSVVGDVVANHSLEHACLCMRWASRLRWLLTFRRMLRNLAVLPNRTAGIDSEK